MRHMSPQSLGGHRGEVLGSCGGRNRPGKEVQPPGGHVRELCRWACEEESDRGEACPFYLPGWGMSSVNLSTTHRTHILSLIFLLSVTITRAPLSLPP